MKPEQLYEKYPKLYHIAWGGSCHGIMDNGLLSTKCLLELYGKSEDEIRKITQNHRATEIEINSPGLPRAVIRDQRPMSDKGLRAVLPNEVEPSVWYDLINSMVFFWPRKQSLSKMIKSYPEIQHDILILDTKKLVELEKKNIRLSHLNSGSTRYGHKRDLDIFKTIEDYPFGFSKKQTGLKRVVAEVCVLDRVEKISDAVIGMKHGLAEEILNELAIE
ncbi:MAG: hypothetical protein F4203_08720 [Rhodobacteraceae bacterium]|nr:hypothetical protein [Paracoccaceae bacterium]